MPDIDVTHAEHRIDVAAPADAVYGLVADVARWPVVFGPTVHVMHLEHAPDGVGSERFRIWATANDAVKTWVSRRELDPGRRRVRFRQEVSQPPVAAMGGEWIVTERDAGSCSVTLLHDWHAVDDDPAAGAWIAEAVDRNSTSELASLRDLAETREERDALTLTFDDVVHVDAPPGAVYAFLDEACLWSQRLPHVARVRLTEDDAGVQILSMDTRTADGAEHTTESVRVCFPPSEIVYKQTRVPALMTAHTGRWRVEADGDQTVVTSTHTVVLRPSAVPTVLGEGATIDDARLFVREALGRNSSATMRAAKEHAERLAAAAVT